jgi:hypothetical protein
MIYFTVNRLANRARRRVDWKRDGEGGKEKRKIPGGVQGFVRLINIGDEMNGSWWRTMTPSPWKLLSDSFLLWACCCHRPLHEASSPANSQQTIPFFPLPTTFPYSAQRLPVARVSRDLFSLNRLFSRQLLSWHTLCQAEFSRQDTFRSKL